MRGFYSNLTEDRLDRDLVAFLCAFRRWLWTAERRHSQVTICGKTAGRIYGSNGLGIPLCEQRRKLARDAIAYSANALTRTLGDAIRWTGWFVPN